MGPVTKSSNVRGSFEEAASRAWYRHALCHPITCVKSALFPSSGTAIVVLWDYITHDTAWIFGVLDRGGIF